MQLPVHLYVTLRAFEQPALALYGNLNKVISLAQMIGGLEPRCFSPLGNRDRRSINTSTRQH